MARARVELAVARPPRKGRSYAWGRPREGEEALFELLVSWRWLAAATAAILPLGAGLLALPPRRRVQVLGPLVATMFGGGLLGLAEGLRGAAFPRLERVD